MRARDRSNCRARDRADDDASGSRRRSRRPPRLDTFEAYVGEHSTVAAGPQACQRLAIAAVERVARCRSTERFNVAFVRVGPFAAALPGIDGVRLRVHGSGQRLALHLERGGAGCTACFNLLA